MAMDDYSSEASFDVDAETSDLREIRGARQVEDVHVVEDLDTVESAEDEDATVGEAGSVVSTRRRWSASDLAGLVL